MEKKLILNSNDFPFLNFNDSNLNEQVKKYILLGYHVSNSIQFSPESNSDIFHTINNSIGCLQESINRFHGKSINSTLKGKEMEDIIQSIIIQNFPDATIECTAKRGQESDFHIDIDNQLSGLIEVKCYTSNVNQKEIDKFIKDLSITKKKFGIFASISSGIVNKHRLQIEYINEQIIIYIPNIKEEYYKLIWGILLVIQLFNIKNKESIKNIDTSAIVDIIETYQKTYQGISKLNFSLGETKKIIYDELDKICKQCIELEFETKILLDKTIKKINIILNEFNSDCIKIPAEDIKTICEYYKSKDYKSYRKLNYLLLNILKIETIYLIKNDKNDKLFVYSEKINNTLCEIKVLKNIIKIKFIQRNIEIEWNELNEDIINQLLIL